MFEQPDAASRPSGAAASGATPAMLRIKRTYDAPAREDGRRILVERLWPRGMTKEAVAVDAWMKDVAPSGELRRWFGHRVERWDEFRRRYRTELDANPGAWQPILDAEQHGTVTLLYSARDAVHNGAVVLREYLLERPAGPARGGTRARPRRAGKATAARRSATMSRSGRAAASRRGLRSPPRRGPDPRRPDRAPASR